VTGALLSNHSIAREKEVPVGNPKDQPTGWDPKLQYTN